MGAICSTDWQYGIIDDAWHKVLADRVWTRFADLNRIALSRLVFVCSVMRYPAIPTMSYLVLAVPNQTGVESYPVAIAFGNLVMCPFSEWSQSDKPRRDFKRVTMASVASDASVMLKTM